jgi:integrase
MMTEKRAPRPQKSTRDPKGSGGLVGPDAKHRYRGYKSIEGHRQYTSWFPTKQLARDAIKILRAPEPAPVSHTVAAAIAAFIDERPLESSTRGGYEQSARHYLAELLAVEVADLKREVVSDHYKDMARKKKLSISTIRQAHAVLKGGLAYAVNSGWVQVNVAATVTLPSAEQAQVEAHAPEDRAALLAATVGNRYEARFRLGLIWALRPGEATGLRWSNVDLAAGSVTVTGQLQRSKIDVAGQPLGTIYKKSLKTLAGARTVPIDAETLNLLKTWRIAQVRERADQPLTERQISQRAAQADRLTTAVDLGLLSNPRNYSVAPDDLIFTLPNGDPMLPRYDADLWRALAEKAGVDHSRIYRARHTAITYLLKQGAPTLEVSLTAGHNDAGFTQRRYAKALQANAAGLSSYL